ncbi:metal-dependent phosphohydrolase [Candidatus Woesearchaeota archaeon]|nr:metal-dependent phosphohydrolase [Candidatus Woesearchaeota archaeon]
METSDYFTAPASTKYHGNFEGGLAAHSMAIYEVFKERVKQYGLDVPEESICICAFLHDYVKVDFYEPNFNKDGSRSKKPWVVQEDVPLGHGEASVMKLLEMGLKMTDQEKVIIRWHMGSYEGEPWKLNSNKIKDKYPEALVFHHVDNEVSTVYNL